MDIILDNKLALLQQKRDIIFEIYFNLDDEKRDMLGEHFRRAYCSDFKIGDDVIISDAHTKPRISKIVSFRGYIDSDTNELYGYVVVKYYNGRKLNLSPITYVYNDNMVISHYEFPPQKEKKRKMRRFK